MKITIKVEEQIPYTTDRCVEEQQIDPNALYQANFDLAGKVIREMQDRVNKAVDVEMEKRGIKLGEDGLRLPNRELRQAAREASDCKLDAPAALPPANG